MEWLLSNNNHFYDASIPSVAPMIFPLYSYIPVSHQTFNTTIPQSSTLLSLVCFSTFRSEGFHQVALTFEFVDEILNFEDLSLNFCYLSFMRKEKQFPFFFFFSKINCLQQHQLQGLPWFLFVSKLVYVGEKSTSEGY